MTVHSTFNIGEPLAYFLTWTTYGTWLPGDERGWNRKGVPEILPPNALFVEMAQSQLKRILKTHEPTRSRFWSEGGSRRWINTEEDLDAVVVYVMDAQDRKGV